MAESIKGISVVIGAETTALTAALSDVNKKSRDVQSELKQVEKLLKLDPTNTDLIAQKQKLLGDAVANTRDKLDRLRAAQEQVNQQFANGDITEGQYRAFQREVVKTEQELADLDNRLRDVTDEVDDQGDHVRRLGDDYRESFEQAQQSLGNTFEQAKKVGAGITAVGAGIAYALGGAVGSARDFEQSMSNVKSVMSPDEVQEYSGALEDLAVKLGADTKYSATEAAQGIEELVKAGVKTADILNGGLSGALSLATAGELELGDAAEIASTALNAFSKDGLTVQRAADLLAGAANASATSVSELKFGLSQVSAVASGVGLSFEDTATALAIFAQNGLKGSDAGTSLKTMLGNLVPKTDAAYYQFQQLGLLTVETDKAMAFMAKNGIKAASNSVEDIEKALSDYFAVSKNIKPGTAKADKNFQEMAASAGLVHSAFYDTNGDIKDMAAIADLLQGALKDLNAEQRQTAMYTMFGSDAIRAGNILFKEGAAGINNMAEAMNKIGAEDVAAQKMDNLNGAIEQLSGSVETAKISIGNALLPALKQITSVIQKVVDAFNGMPQGMQQAIAISAAVAAALALIIGPLLMLIGFLPAIAAGFSMLAPIFAALMGPIGLVIAAVAALAAGVILVIKNWDSISAFFVRLWDDVAGVFTRAWDGLTDLLARTWQAISGAVQTAWSGIVSTIMHIIEPFIATALKTWNGFKEGIAQIFNGLKTFFEGIWLVIKNVFAGALLLIVDLVTGDFKSLSKDAQAIWNNLKAAFGQIWEGIKQVFSGYLTAVASLLSGTWSAIRTAAELAWKGITGAVSGALEGLKTAAGNIAEGIKTAINGAIEWIKNLPDQMTKLGKNIMQGLIDGIASMAKAITDKVSDIAGSITGGLKKVLDIHSPSRVTMEIGRFTGAGLAEGLERSIAEVKRQAAAMSAAATPKVDVLTPSAAIAPEAGGVFGGKSTISVPVYLDGQPITEVVSTVQYGSARSRDRLGVITG